MYKITKRHIDGVVVENVVPRIISLTCYQCGKTFASAVLSCNDLPETTTIRWLDDKDRGFDLKLFCSRECAEAYLKSRQEKGA